MPVIRSPLMQNDEQLTQYESIAPAGCLWRCLLHVAELEAEKTLSDLALLSLYEEAVETGSMKTNCYVLDHEHVGQGGLDYLGIDKRFVYVERESHDPDRVTAWARPDADHYEPNYYFWHFETLSSNGGTIGHFVVAWEDMTCRWDPYFPSCEPLSNRSFRLYAVV